MSAIAQERRFCSDDMVALAHPLRRAAFAPDRDLDTKRVPQGDFDD